MSITVRLWSTQDLAKALTCEDPQLTTTLLNGTSFSEEEIQVVLALRDAGKVKDYYAHFLEMDESVIRFKAVDDASAKWFLSQEYMGSPDGLEEIITTYREVEL